MQPNNPTPFRVIRLRELKSILGVSRSTIYNWMQAESRYFQPDFPRPIKLGKASIGWRDDEVQNFLKARGRA